MNFEDDFMTFSSEVFSKMRLVLEGVVALFEDEVCPVYRQLRDSGEPSAVRAFDDIGTALYAVRSMFVSCRRHITRQRSSRLLKYLLNNNEK